MEVFPESVQGSGEFLEGDEKEILQIDTYNAQVVTIKAVQDLIVENKSQQQQIQNLEHQNQILQEKVKEIEMLKSELEAIKALLTQK